MVKPKPMPKEFWRDQKWGFTNYSKLVRKYPNQWIAISNKKVVAAGDLGEVEKKAKEKTKKKHVPVIFVESGSHIY